VTARRNQLLILLLFFGLVGIFSGIIVWQLNQSQQRERSLMQVQTDLEQTNQQMQILKQQSNAALATRSKLQKDLANMKKQLDAANQRSATLEQNLKTAQSQSSGLATENSSLKTQLGATRQELAVMKESIGNTSKSGASNSRAKPGSLLEPSTAR
jgi:chromosome segregation ATPase